MLNAYLQAFAQAIGSCNAHALANLVKIPQDFSEQRYKELLPQLELADDPVPEMVWSGMCSQVPGVGGESVELWAEVARVFLKCLRLYRKVRLSSGAPSARTVFNAWLSLCQAYLRILQTGQRWHLLAAYGLCEELWSIAKQASEEEGSDGASEEAARFVNRVFTACITDRSSGLEASRKWGAYRIAGLLSRIYFGLNQLPLCNNAIRAMGAAHLPPIERYPAASRVTFRYYLGRYYFVNGKYSEGEKELFLAFKECHKDAFTAKRQCLHLLIPLRLICHGTIPKPELLERYTLSHGFYADALRALRQGDLALYRSLLEVNEGQLLELGTFPLWERLMLIAYRALVKRVNIILGSTSRLPLRSLQTAFGSSMDIDEISCTLAGLVGCGLVRGYISQSHAMLVLSQKDPFPAISNCKL